MAPPLGLASLTMELGQSTLDWVTAISAAVAAVGTVLAVVVALYLNVWREWRRQPALSVELYEESNFGVGWKPGERDDDDAWGVPLLVQNAPRRSTAHGTEVLVTVGRREGDEWVDYVVDEALIWKVATRPEGEGLTAIDIPGGARRKLYLAFIGEANVLYRILWPRDPMPGLFADADGRQIEYGEGGHSFPVSPPIAGVLATYPFNQDNPFWLWRDQEFRFRLTLTSHTSDAVTYEMLVTFAFTRGVHGHEHEGGPDYIQPRWSRLKRVKQ